MLITMTMMMIMLIILTTMMVAVVFMIMMIVSNVKMIMRFGLLIVAVLGIVEILVVIGLNR